MKKLTVLILSTLIAMAMLTGALADTLTLDGTITAAETVNVYAPIGGTVGDVAAEAGQAVRAGDVLFSFTTDKVYAEADGTVTGVFGEPGDSASAVASRYGSVLYLEEDSVFSVSASTDNAYNSTETKFVHVGETVWLQCRSNNARTGVGVITAISGTSYTIRVTSGSFIPGDAVNCYRDAAYTNSLKIGQGTVSRVNPTAVTASGAIVRIAVQDGDRVRRGDLLLETLNGDFAGYSMTGTDVTASADGVLGSLNVNLGGNVSGGSVVAVIWMTDTMRVEAVVPEDFRSEIHEGDRVIIELVSDESVAYEGVVTLVSAVAETGNGETGYKVLVDFVPDERVTFGMSVLVTTIETDDEVEAAEPADEEPETEEEATDEDPAESGRPSRNGVRPEGGFPEGGFPDGMPEGGFPEGGFPEGMSGRPSSAEETDDDADQ